MKRIRDKDGENHKNIKFVIEYGDPVYEEIISYSELSDIIEKQHLVELEAEEPVWTFKNIINHKGPLKPSDPDYKGSSWNVLVEWDDGSKTWEPLDMIGKDDPAFCAKYGLENDLLEKKGWKRFRRLARRTKKLERMAKQAMMATK